MRVVVLDHTAALGGAEIALSRLLPALDGDRYEVSVLLFADGPLVERLRDAGTAVEVRPLDPATATLERTAVTRSPWRAAQAAGRAAAFTVGLARALRRERADLVVANSLKAALIGGTAATLARTPWVWHLHDRLSEDYLPGPVARVLRGLARRAPRQVVVNSQATLRSLGPIPADRVVVAYPGLPAPAFAPRDEPSSGDPVVGIVGRISPTKGQREFVDAAAQVVASHPEARFVVVGAALFAEGAYEAELRAYVAERGLTDHVAFTGWLADPSQTLRTLDLLVHASPVPEPFGQVVVEAMAVGIPVVATAAGGVVEILDPAGSGDTDVVTDRSVRRTPLGQLVPPADVDALATAVRWVLDHPVDAAAAAARARASAQERFTLERTAEAVTTAWDRALAGRSASS
ncbi:glycosyltransferase [Mumia sp. DW29H23]|uniref:glycosyltransferase n=1 Tax=Mumia sp. DW29H23 TaxID=3421241 RepID=UPI003D68AA74